MNASDLGYNKDLFILPFDHKSSFEAGLLGIRGRQANPTEVENLRLANPGLHRLRSRENGFLAATGEIQGWVDISR